VMPRTYYYTETESSQISSVGYDFDALTLWLTFRRSPGVRYRYDNTVPGQVAAIMFAKSIGSEASKFAKARGEDFVKEEVKETGPTFT